MKKGNSKDFFRFFIVLAAMVFIVLPLMLNSFFLAPTKIITAEGLGNAEWLSFWGSYISGALGVITTMLAFMLTYRQNDKQNKDIQEQNRIIQEQNTEMQTVMKEQMRLQALPFINVTVASSKNDLPITNDLAIDFNGYATDDIFEEFDTDYFVLSNIGVGPAIDVSIASKKLGHISVDSEQCLVIGFPTSDIVNIITTELHYSDRESRKYRQTLTFECIQKGSYEISSVGSPELI